MGEKERFDARAQEPKIGEILRGAREERGLSLEEVEQATKIRTLYLKGLERDDHGMLPAPVYVQGFLKTYADYLGLDGAGLVRELKGRQTPAPKPRPDHERTGDGFERPLISPGDLAAAAGRSRVPVGAVSALFLAAFAFAAVVGVLYFIGRGSQPSQDVAGGSSPPPGAAAERASREERDPAPAAGTTAAAGSAAEETTGGTTREETTEATDPDTLRATVRVRNRPSWLQVETDGNIAFARIARPGFSKSFEAKRVIGITTGDAGAVRAEINGQNVGFLGDSGEVLTRRFTLKPESAGG